ncbi:zinc finger protein 11-like [Cloeon dipterum]|uniref:zinc finger protein 11-like n=1 Tax=Cloeon dipterum TaxID=197152 RepID=UPI0032200ECE
MESIRRHEMQPREGKTPIQKPLCRLCECPTSDGHVLASQVDRLKLRKWAMEVMNLTEEDENLPDVVEEDALICYFCIWQAEFGDESGDEAVAWWPKNLDLEENAKVLRENYSIGEVEQCWVQLEEVDLAEYEKEIPKKKKCVSGVCIYCGKSYNHLMNHVNYMHKKAIKCGIRGCVTYFHTEEEKEQHMQQVSHEKQNKPQESRKIRCKYCETVLFLSSSSNLKKHMFRKHPEFPVVCTRPGCNEYFKTKSEMMNHFNSSHKQAVNQDLYLCKHCEYFTPMKYRLREHEEARHMPKIFKCGSCDAKFGAKRLVGMHYKEFHTFDKCKTCGQDVSLSYKAVHRKPSVCCRCKLSFGCSGLYQLHWKSCKKSLFSCKECGKTFPVLWKLNKHVRKAHTKTSIVYCDHCNHSTLDKSKMSMHMQRKHLPKTIKCGECNKFFASECILKNHKYESHSFLRCAECAQELSRCKLSYHQTVKTCRHCECKFKCQGLLEKHMKCCDSNNYYFCDKCPKIYDKKSSLYYHILRNHIEK